MPIGEGVRTATNLTDLQKFYTNIRSLLQEAMLNYNQLSETEMGKLR